MKHNDFTDNLLFWLDDYQPVEKLDGKSEKQDPARLSNLALMIVTALAVFVCMLYVGSRVVEILGGVQ